MRKFFTLLLCCVAFAANAQVHSIRGTVSSEADGSPVVGVMVLVEGTNTYAMTDALGEYTIGARPGEILTFSLLGYLPRNITVGASAVIDVQLEIDATLIDNLVVVGYGVQKKSVVTAAIGSVKAAQLENQTPTRLESVLQGQVAGVNIVRNSGQPGSPSLVRIRGIGTTTEDGASDPLYVVDGMPVSGGIDYLNPRDIESVEVLKDAASAAVYGTKGANGVILVTTKRGTSGDARVTYDFQYGWQNPWKLRSVLNATEYQTLQNEMSINAGEATIPYADASSHKYDTNWQKEVFNFNAPIQDHQLSVSGANDRVNYYVSLGYLDHEGLVGGNYGRSNYDRLTIRANNTYKLMDRSATRDWLAKANLGVNAQYAHFNSTGITTRGVMGGQISSALLLPPNQPVYSDDPDAMLAAFNPAANTPPVRDGKGRYYNIIDLNELVNPIADMDRQGARDRNWNDKFVANFWADLEIYKGLTFRSSYGVDLAYWGLDSYQFPYYLGPKRSDPNSSARSTFHRGFTWQIDNTLTYQNRFGKHGLTVLVGQSARAERGHNLDGSSIGLLSPDGDLATINNTTTPNGSRSVSGEKIPQYRLASYFGRVSYDFDERYMVEFTIRRDGSTRFAQNNRWAIFPSVSAGWNITNESFAENFPLWISNLKLRASWGQNGNDKIDNFKYLTVMAPGNNYPFGVGETSSIWPGQKPNGTPNSYLKWEASEQTDIGFDASFLGSSLNFSFDWFRKVTHGMLIEMGGVPTYIGDSKPIGNVGDMLNTGVEFDLDYRYTVGKWDFGARFNATWLENRVENLGNADGFVNRENINFIGTVTRDENGMPFHYFYGRQTDGIFQTWDEVNDYVGEKGLIQPNAAPGDVRYVDIDGNGSIGDEDRTMIGKFLPDWTYNFGIDVAWNGIDLSLFFQGVAGSDIFDATRRLDLSNANMPAYMLERWRGPGTSNSIPRLTRAQESNWVSSDLYVQNGAYLRLKNLQLGYTIPDHITKKLLISKLRVYFMAENLLTFTGYRGFDPEMENGVDTGVYPQPRTLSVGVNLAF